MAEELKNTGLVYSSVEPDIEYIQNQMRELFKNKHICHILGEDFVKKVKDWDAAISKRRVEPFSLVVLGDFKRGKSTIINAILGKNLTPVNVAPETFTINSITYGETPLSEAVLKNGQRITLTPEDLVRENLEKLTRAFPDALDHISIKDNVEILKEIRIVDTPGLSDLDCLDKQVQDYLVHADAVIYIASALSPFSESEQVFLASHVRPMNFSKLFVLVNMIDAMNTWNDIEKIISRVAERCEMIMPNVFVYGVSGIDEYRRKIGLNRPDIKGFQEYYENEFLKFEVALRQEIILQKDVLRTQRVLTMLNLMLKDIATRIHMIYDVIDIDKKKLGDMKAEYNIKCANLSNFIDKKRDELCLITTEMQQQAEQWMYGFFAKLREEILETRNKAEAVDIDKYFYNYLVDKVGEAYKKCLDLHEAEIEEFIVKTNNSLEKTFGSTDIHTTSGVDNDALNSLNNLVTNSVLQAAAAGTKDAFPSATLGSFKNILKRKRQTDIIDTALENYNDIRINTVKDLQAAYKVMYEAALDQLEDIYDARAESGRATLLQAQTVSDNQNNEEIKAQLKKAVVIFDDAVSVLKKYKQ